MGHYKSVSHVLDNGDGPFPDSSGSEFWLNPNMKYLFKKGNVSIVGRWSAYDNGDHTVLELTLPDGSTSDNFVGGGKRNSSIELLNTRDFNFTGYSSVIFYEVNH